MASLFCLMRLLKSFVSFPETRLRVVGSNEIFSYSIVPPLSWNWYSYFPGLFRHLNELIHRSEVEVHVAVGVAGCGDDVATVHHEVRMRVWVQA